MGPLEYDKTGIRQKTERADRSTRTSLKTTLEIRWMKTKMAAGSTSASISHGLLRTIMTIDASTMQMFCSSSSTLNGNRTSTAHSNSGFLTHRVETVCATISSH